MTLILEVAGLWLLAAVITVAAVNAAKSAFAHRSQP